MPLKRQIPRSERQARFLWRVLLWGLGLIPLSVTPFWPRSFELLTYTEALASAFGSARTVAQLATLTILGLAAGTLALGLYWHSRFGLPRQLWLLLLGVFLLALGPMLSSFLGISPVFSAGHLAAPLALMAVVFLPTVPLSWFVAEVKRLTLLYVAGSLAVAVVAPSWAWEIPYTQGYIPGFEVRLHGVTVHAIQTSLFVLLYIMFELTFPSSSPWRWLGLGAAGLVLVLTQSKTTLALLLLGLGLMYLLRLSEALQRPTAGKIRFFLIPLMGLSLLFLGFLAVVVSGVDILGNIATTVQEREEALTTLTGRTYIWAVILDVVRENPWFGYGPHLWDPEMALAYAPMLGWTPAHSHNQYFQSLGEGGIIGLAGLIVYGLLLLRTGWLYSSLGHGLPFVLPLLWFVRAFTESWYRKATTDGNLVIHMIIFAFLVVLAKNRGRKA